MAVILSESLGRHIKAVEISMAQACVQMLTAKSEGIDNLDMPAPRRTTPTIFREWCDHEFRALIGNI